MILKCTICRKEMIVPEFMQEWMDKGITKREITHFKCSRIQAKRMGWKIHVVEDKR